MILTSKEIHTILEALSKEVVIPPSSYFPYTISVKRHGYSDNVEIGQLQAKLSMMLEVAVKSEKR